MNIPGANAGSMNISSGVSMSGPAAMLSSSANVANNPLSSAGVSAPFAGFPRVSTPSAAFYWSTTDSNPAGENPDNPPAENQREPQQLLPMIPLSGPTARFDFQFGSVYAKPASMVYFPDSDISLGHSVYLEHRPDGSGMTGPGDVVTDDFKDMSSASLSVAAVFLGAYWCAPCEGSRDRDKRKKGLLVL